MEKTSENIELVFGTIESAAAVSEKHNLIVLSMTAFYKRKGTLTDSQWNYLQKIYSFYTKEAQEEREQWAINYKSEYRENALIAAHYYKNHPPYFMHVATEILNNSEYVPTKNTFLKMTDNKFMDKVFYETRRESTYGVGEWLTLRGIKSPISGFYMAAGVEDFNMKERYSFFGKKAVVLSTDSKMYPVLNAGKGTKRLLILFAGETKPCVLEEKYFKKAKL